MAIITPLTDDYVVQVVRVANPSLPVPLNSDTVKVSKVTVGTTRVETWIEGTNKGTSEHSDTWVGKIPITTQKLNLEIVFRGLNGLVRLAGDVPTTPEGLAVVLGEYFGVVVPPEELVIERVTPDKVGRRIVFSVTPESRSYYGGAEVYLRPPFIDFDTVPVPVLDFVPNITPSDWVIARPAVCPNLAVASSVNTERVLVHMLDPIKTLDYSTGTSALPVELKEPLRYFCFNLCAIDIPLSHEYIVKRVSPNTFYEIRQVINGTPTKDYLTIYFEE